MDMFKKIIVRLPNWIGDLVMATPVLSDLRNRFPASEITAMCSRPLSDLLLFDPAVDRVKRFSRAGNLVQEKWRMEKYDLGVLLTNSFSSAWQFWRAKIERRLGYGGHWRSMLLTDCVQTPRQRMHQVDFYKHLLQPLGIGISNTAPRLFFSKQEEAAAMEKLAQKGYRDGCPLIGVHPGAFYGPSKCWPPDRFRKLAFRLLQNPETFAVFFGDADSASLNGEICRGLSERAINLAGDTDLRELACVIKNCDVLVANDSGPMHIGAALQTPIVALFGSTDDAITGPWGQKDAVINKRAGCSPCFKRICPADFRCMQQITVEEVAFLTMERMKKRV